MDWSCLACGSVCPDGHQFCGFCGARRTAAAGGGGEVDDVLRALVGEQLRAALLERGGRLPEERRLVSALFADLSGFTSLAGRLDPETLAMVVDPILAALVRIVKRREGYVGSFAGDALLCYFGAPVAHEDDATRAVRCALEMLEEFPALLAAAPEEASTLALRIGIDTGAVMARLVAGDIKTDYNILGNSVNMSQRLQSNAPMGALVVGETTYRLTVDDFDYEDIGPLQVKGRAEPLPAYLLRGRRERSIQRRVQRSVAVHGRDAELAALAEAERPAPARGIVLVAEAGAGKSRLLQEARTRSSRPWFEGGCSVEGKEHSYRPWCGALAPLVGDASPDGLRILMGRDRDVEELPPAVRRDVVARDVTALLRAAAPAVVVLEDLHWADRPSLDLLDDVLFGLGDADVLVVATSREKISATAELAPVELAPLSAGDVAALLADVLGGDPPEDLVDEVARRSGGNPLYVSELALALRERGVVSLVDGGVLVTAATGLATALDVVPDSIEGLIGARIDALPAAQERALTIAAVLGAPVTPGLVAAVTARLAEPYGEVPGALDGLRESRLLDGQDFVHALVQSTAYLRTPRARRRHLHLAAAEIGPDHLAPQALAGYLARHLYLAGAEERALVALEDAVAEALSRGAHEEALVHLYRDLELRRGDGVDPGRRAVLPQRLVAAGELLELLGRYAEAEPVFRDAIEVGAGPVAYRGLVGSLRRLGRYDDVVTIADEILTPLDDRDLRARISWEKAAALAALGRLDEAIVALEPGPTSASQARQDLIRAYCLIQSSDDVAAEPVLRAALAVLEEAGDVASVVHGKRNLGWLRSVQGRYDEAIAVLEQALRLARAAGAAEEVMTCANNLSVVAGDAGDNELALHYSRVAVTQSDRMRHSFNRVASRNNLADALVESGRADEAVGVATRALELAREHGTSGIEGAILHTRGLAHLGLGATAAARADAEEAWPLVQGTPYEAVVQELLDDVTKAESSGTSSAPGDPTS